MRPFEGFDDYSPETLSATEAHSRASVVSRRLSRPLRHAHLDSNLITEFFFVFSRFEYALKRAGFVKSYCQMLWIGLRSRGDLLLVPFDQFSHHEPGPGPHQRD